MLNSSDMKKIQHDLRRIRVTSVVLNVDFMQQDNIIYSSYIVANCVK